jgi:phenylalanine-4-hydroxylase
MNKSPEEKRFREIAGRHGVDFDSVTAASAADRLEQLEACLSRTDVPFPIDAQYAAPYLDRARNGVPFDIGSLCAQTVDLGPYSNQQHYERYSLEEHLSWACLIAEQQRTKHRFACREYLAGEELFSIGGTTIPDFYLLNARIYQQTEWQLATVSMIIPAELFFTCHSQRFFPVTTFMRALEQDYLQEPDIGHDVAGHVATFTIPTVAHVMRNHGIARNWIYEERDTLLSQTDDPEKQRAIRSLSDELLLYAERIYWFTVEFGLVMQANEVRAYGAGILSSPGETQFSVLSPRPTRIVINPSCDRDLLRLATTDYLISEFQKTYFVIESFELLESLTPERIVATAKLAAKLPHFSWRDIAPGDRILQVGESAVSTNEKYLRLMCEQLCDDCLTRTAIRNLQLLQHGLDPTLDLNSLWSGVIAPVPTAVIDWFRQIDSEKKFDVPLRPLSY